MKYIIRKLSKSATQSGPGENSTWILEPIYAKEETKETLMGWISSSNTQKQVKLKFNSEEEAISYAKSHNLTYEMKYIPKIKKKYRSYSENFN